MGYRDDNAFGFYLFNPLRCTLRNSIFCFMSPKHVSISRDRLFIVFFLHPSVAAIAFVACTLPAFDLPVSFCCSLLPFISALISQRVSGTIPALVVSQSRGKSIFIYNHHFIRMNQAVRDFLLFGLSLLMMEFRWDMDSCIRPFRMESTLPRISCSSSPYHSFL